MRHVRIIDVIYTENKSPIYFYYKDPETIDTLDAEINVDVCVDITESCFSTNVCHNKFNLSYELNKFAT